MDDKFFMQKALVLAKNALSAGEFPVGCVMVHNGDILATGSRKGTSKKTSNEIDHAELIALRNLSRLTTALNPEIITVYSTLEPCLMCTAPCCSAEFIKLYMPMRMLWEAGPDAICPG